MSPYNSATFVTLHFQSVSPMVRSGYVEVQIGRYHVALVAFIKDGQACLQNLPVEYGEEIWAKASQADAFCVHGHYCHRSEA